MTPDSAHALYSLVSPNTDGSFQNTSGMNQLFRLTTFVISKFEIHYHIRPNTIVHNYDYAYTNESRIFQVAFFYLQSPSYRVWNSFNTVRTLVQEASTTLKASAARA